MYSHVIVWGLYTVYSSSLIKYFYGFSFSVAFIVQIILHRLGDVFLFYINASWILPKYLSFKKVYLLISTFILGVTCYVFYCYALEFYIFKFLGTTIPNDTPILIQVISQSVLTGSNFIIFSIGYYFAQKAIQQEKEIAQQKVAMAEKDLAIAKKELELSEEKAKNAILAKEKAQAEMAFLRSQINPHFMFNTLNMIYSKVRSVSKDAGNIVIEFADMMRYATSTKLQDNEVDLRGELDFVKQYLSLHKQRNQQNAFIDYDEEGYFGSHRIVPMVLITLVENGIKHGLIDDSNFPLKIRASLIDEIFVFIVHNLKNPHSDQIMDKGNTGIGIKNILKRLDAVYSNGGFTLETEEGEDDYLVTFTVDFNLIKK
ncbi:MAG: histidine kinase [Bacteroidota bacterium]